MGEKAGQAAMGQIMQGCVCQVIGGFFESSHANVHKLR